MAAALARILDEVKIFVGPDLLDADEHGTAPCSRQGTTILRITTSKIKDPYCNRPRYLAPHAGAAGHTFNNSADLSDRSAQNCGSWVRLDVVPIRQDRR